jgi:beta-glucosidase-like glycosyl hydrolase/CubicO group peptidase (beta-lactamase class C family)
MIRAYSNKDEKYDQELIGLISELNIGGVCFFQGGPARQAILTNRLQQATQTPVFVAIDAEWGPGMRLDSINNFPKQMTLGAMRNNSTIYQMGTEVAHQLIRLGVHINFAPVADINNNPLNPVINARSFGENKQLVAEKSYWYMKGMQDGGIIAVAKHFPGHGDTGNDSHYTLPVINKSMPDIDSLELYPFRFLIKRGLKGMMVAHLKIPAMDTARKSISSLSRPIITDILRTKLGFDGMVITDGVDMKGVVDFTDPAMVELLALEAGNDIVLLPVAPRNAIVNIRKAIDSGLISQEAIDAKCKRVLQWKYESGLSKMRLIALKNMHEDLNTPLAAEITHKANAAAITLVTDPRNLVPLQSLDTLKIASLLFGDKKPTAFQRRLGDYANVTHFNLSKNPGKTEMDSVMKMLKPYNLVITGFVETSDLPQKNFGISQAALLMVDSLSLKQKTILCLFTSPYSMGLFRNINNMAAVLVSYQDNPVMQDLTAQAIFGGIPITGRLPVTAGKFWPVSTGIERTQQTRLAFTLPELAGVSSAKLKEVDKIVLEGIEEHAYPGAQIIIIKDEKLIYRKAFGKQTYESETPLHTDDIYDLASLTKVLGTTLATMKLTGDKKLDPDLRLSHYYPPLKNTSKNNVIIRDILAHKAKFQPYIPFWKPVLKNGDLNPKLFGAHYSVNYPHRVADGIYLQRDYPEKIIDSIINSPLLSKTQYKYSDLGFILLGLTIEEITQQPLNSYLSHSFYDKLGLTTMGFHPRERFDLDRLVPTENDTLFRKQVIHGDVHDPTAALLGGVAGHAGLFSDAMDVAIIMQMILNNGIYGGDTLLDAGIIKDFTRIQFALEKNRRGAGFDKPAIIKGDPSPTCISASSDSFGHSGFTGTYTWADPQKGLVYVFLSNRVYPDADNNKLVKMNIRTRIQEAIYQAIAEDEKGKGGDF